MKNRLFVSLNLPGEIRDRIIDLHDSVSNDRNIKWEPKEKLHLTIKFIGDVSSQIMNDIALDLAFIQNYSEIKCSVIKFGFFYRDNKPTILWIGLETDGFLKRLVTELNERLNKYSIPIEKRKFSPHITLLRIKSDPGINFVNNFKNFTFEPILFRANSVTLFKSILQPGGSKYSEIKNYKLKKSEK